MELPNLQMLPTKNLLSMICFKMTFAHKLVFLLKQLTGFGKMPRETSRSKSRVQYYMNTSSLMLSSITSN
jgi:hypothetical protein